jgi:hypothetical protein
MKKLFILSIVTFGISACTTKSTQESTSEYLSEEIENVSLVPIVPENDITSYVPSDEFSVGMGKKIKFSPGNLQYQASTGTWRFARHQWDMIGEDNSNISSMYGGWIDLFGWGTGNNPTLSSRKNFNYSNFVDWGLNNITNRRNDMNAWRALTSEEWDYLIKSRENAADLRGQASINGVNGYVLLPDNWTLPDGLTFTSDPRNWTTNQYSISDWSKMEEAGAVFLPAAGYREGREMVDVNNEGGYWSSTPLANHEGFAWYFCFNSFQAYTGDILRFGGFSVRLVCPIEDTSDAWIYGTWKCNTPYGTIKIIINKNGRMYDSIEEGWFSYSIESTRIWEQLDGYGSSYPLDRANKRIGTGEPDVWFSKVSDDVREVCEKVTYYDEELEVVRQTNDDQLSYAAEKSAEKSQSEIDIYDMNNTTPFNIIKWKVDYLSDVYDAWFSEKSGLTTDNKSWTSGMSESMGWYALHRFNKTQYTCNYLHSSNSLGGDGYGDNLGVKKAVRDCERNTLPTENGYYVLDLRDWQGYKPLYLPYSQEYLKSKWQRGMIKFEYR